MSKFVSETPSVMSKIDDLRKIVVKQDEKMNWLETNWKSLMSNMGPSDVISTKSKKIPAHKNVLAGKNKLHMFTKPSVFNLFWLP